MRDTSNTCFIDCFKQSLLFSFLAFSLFLGSSETMARTSPLRVSIMECPFISSVDAPHAVQGRDSISKNQDKNHGNLETLPVWKEGGAAGLQKFIKENLHYPKESVQKRIQGKVIVRFIIGKNGSVMNAKVVRSVDSLLDKEALRVVGIMPPWIPGSFKGEPAKAYFVIPITFTLNSYSSSDVMSFIKSLTADSLQTVHAKDSISRSENQNGVYDEPETPPVWKEGGTAGLYDFIDKNLHYPKELVKERIQGKVMVRFIVAKDGSVTNPRVVRSLSPLLDQEALRVVGIMPPWTPGLMYDKPSKSYFVLPITFTLDSLHVKSFIKSLVASGNCPLIVVNGEIKSYPVDYQRKFVENGFLEKEAVANWFNVKMRDVKKIEVIQPKKAIELFGTKGTKDGVVKYTIKNLPYEKVDKPAAWKEGGDTALFSFLSANLKYPVVCQENGVQGIVLVRFIVEKDGSIGYASVIRSSGATFLDQEALRVINLMPNWNPGLIKGKPVRSFYVVPIKFSLKK